MVIPVETEAGEADGSFGAQQILKEEPRLPTFAIVGESTLIHTSNVALAAADETDDFLWVTNLSANWFRTLGPQWNVTANISGAFFRYHETTELDFENLSAGAGLNWTPAALRGVSFLARYDFVELLDSHSNEMLRDHELSLAAQKVFSLGRSHAFSLGLVGMAGFAHPSAAQRDQLSASLNYHLRLTRSLEADLLYRYSWLFYNSGGRQDQNHLATVSLRYLISRNLQAGLFFSYGTNDSNRLAFDYDVMTTGLGMGFNFRF